MRYTNSGKELKECFASFLFRILSLIRMKQHLISVQWRFRSFKMHWSDRRKQKTYFRSVQSTAPMVAVRRICFRHSFAWLTLLWSRFMHWRRIGSQWFSSRAAVWLPLCWMKVLRMNLRFFRCSSVSARRNTSITLHSRKKLSLSLFCGVHLVVRRQDWFLNETARRLNWVQVSIRQASTWTSTRRCRIFLFWQSTTISLWLQKRRIGLNPVLHRATQTPEQKTLCWCPRVRRLRKAWFMHWMM